MSPNTRLGLRKAGICIVLTVGVFATAATSPAQTMIRIPEQHGDARLDAEHPAALSRIVVKINEEATSASFYGGASLSIDTIKPAGGGRSDLSAAGRARFIVTSVRPEGGSPAASSAPDLEPAPSPFEAEVRVGFDVALPMGCGIGPCERAFWLVAELKDPDLGALDVGWRVSGALTFSGTTWPSGAGGSIVIDPAVLIAGPVPQLVVTSEPEVVNLGPRQPAAARLVEVSIGAEGVAADPGQIAVMSVDLTPRPDSGGDQDRRPIVQVYPLDGLGDPERNPDGPLPTVLELEPDPFAGCTPQAACTRRFLVTMEWTGEAGEDEAYDFDVRLRRLDLVGAWAAPTDIAATIERRFDVAPDATASTVHFGGQSTAVRFDDSPQVQLQLAAMTTATDPLARLLPAPAVMTYRTSLLGLSQPAASPERPTARANIDLPGSQNGMRSIHPTIASDGATIITNPFAGCRVGGACQYLEIGTFPYDVRSDAPLPNVPFEWSLEVRLFSFAEAPLTLEAIDQSPAAR